METVAKIAHYRTRQGKADQLLKEFVRIRESKTGPERVLALVQWASQVDAIYLNMPAANAEQPEH